MKIRKSFIRTVKIIDKSTTPKREVKII